MLLTRKTAVLAFLAAFISAGRLQAAGAASQLADLSRLHPGRSGAYVLEKGKEALLMRAWLGSRARKSIDIQYFIWSADNIGILAAEGLLAAAERGVKVRVLVDDLLIDADSQSLLALATRPGIEIRVYNPRSNVGTSFRRKLFNIVTGFRQVNQRMHNKTFIVDGAAGITGGRNMADEYFDFDHAYNFRDRDILLLGPAVTSMQESFEKFWASPLSVPVQELLKKELAGFGPEKAEAVRRDLRLYAQDPENYDEDHRKMMKDFEGGAAALLRKAAWCEASFVSDEPGKNDGRSGLKGGGASTDLLAREVKGARRSIVIQTPYLVLSDFGRSLFRDAVSRGVSVEIVTNSLESTDNLMSYSGYKKIKKDLLALGLKIHEYKPYPGVFRELFEKTGRKTAAPPIFAIHAKTMVIDGERLFIGTFNLDPRSANLNTEAGVLVLDKSLAQQVEEQIKKDMSPENSWDAAQERPARGVPLGRRLKVWLYRLLPLQPLL